MYEGILQQEQNRKGTETAANAQAQDKKMNILAGLLGQKQPKEPNFNDPNVQRNYANRQRIMGY